MSHHLRSVLLFLVACVLAAADPRTGHVVILVMDGARWSETWGDASHQYIPRIAAELAPQGVVLTQFRNRGPTKTNPGHAALCTGVYQEIENGGHELPTVPSLFQYLRRDQGLPETAVWVITSKDKLVVLSDTAATGWTGRHRPSFDCGVDGKGGGGYRKDAVTFEKARTVLTTHAPKAMVINFLGPDATGHAKKWDAYLKAITEVDGYAADLWKTIQSDAKLKDRTTLFIVNDHGRHLDQIKGGFTSHGCDCEGCRHILCVAIGPDFKRGVAIATPYHQPDVTATAAHLLQVAMPTGTGQVMSEILATP